MARGTNYNLKSCGSLLHSFFYRGEAKIDLFIKRKFIIIVILETTYQYTNIYLKNVNNYLENECSQFQL